MTIFDEVSAPQEMDLLVAFFDLTRFTQLSRECSNKKIFEILFDYYEFVGDLVEKSGGKVVKFIGDAGLIVYPADDVNRGVLTLRTLQETGDAWLAERNIKSRNLITAHFGPVMCGLIGTRTDKHFDVFGQTVNTVVTINSNGLALTPQVFRKLDADTRKFFKKHTPPITYIPLGESHRD